jgi:hypothetical protein
VPKTAPSVFWNNRRAVLAFEEEHRNVAASDKKLRGEMAEVLLTFRGCEELGEKYMAAAARCSVFSGARVRVVASKPSSICDDAQAVSSIPSQDGFVLVLSHSQRRGCQRSDIQLLDTNGFPADTERVQWFNMTDSRGKPDRTLALYRVLGKCLDISGHSLTGPRAAAVSRDAMNLCDSGEGLWAGGVTVACVAWHW